MEVGRSCIKGSVVDARLVLVMAIIDAAALIVGVVRVIAVLALTVFRATLVVALAPSESGGGVHESSGQQAC